MCVVTEMCLLRFSGRASAAEVPDVEPSTGEALPLAHGSATTNRADFVKPPRDFMC